MKLRTMSRRTKCDVRGCHSTVTNLITKSSENYGSVYLCDDCVRDTFASVFPDDAKLLSDIKSGERVVMDKSDADLLGQLRSGLAQIIYPGDDGWIDNGLDTDAMLKNRSATSAEDDKKTKAIPEKYTEKTKKK